MLFRKCGGCKWYWFKCGCWDCIFFFFLTDFNPGTVDYIYMLLIGSAHIFLTCLQCGCSGVRLNRFEYKTFLFYYYILLVSVGFGTGGAIYSVCHQLVNYMGVKYGVAVFRWRNISIWWLRGIRGTLCYLMLAFGILFPHGPDVCIRFRSY